MSAVDSSLAGKCMDFCHALTSQKKSFTFSLILGSSFTFSLDTKEDLSPASKAVRRKSLLQNEEMKDGEQNSW